jgi:hypothetical protein
MGPALCTNLTGSIQVARAVVPHLRARAAAASRLARSTDVDGDVAAAAA